jgi:hypothetical protein
VVLLLKPTRFLDLLAVRFGAGLVLSGAVLLAGCAGKGAQGECQELGECGNNPAGNWTINLAMGVGSSCQSLQVRPTQPTEITDFQGATGKPLPATLAPPQANPLVLQQTTSGDWCSQLVYTDMGKVTNANLWHVAPTLLAGTLQLTTDPATGAPTYQTSLFFSTQFAGAEENMTHFDHRCLIANGGNPTCTQLATALTAFYKPSSATIPPAFNDISCTPTAEQGCDCHYSAYVVAVSDKGGWLAQGNTLIQSSTLRIFNGVEVKLQDPTQASSATFCNPNNAGQQLQLTGKGGDGLFGLQGLQNMTLKPM